MIRTTEHTGTHLTLDDRIYIQNALERGLFFKDIALYLRKDPTTISKEVRRNRFEKPRSDSSSYGGHCALEDSCILTSLCDMSPNYCAGDGYCSKCKLINCTMYCTEYIPGICSRLKKPPYVCNGCYKVRSCSYDRMFYRAKYADDLYRENLVESRRGINQSPDELERIDAIVSPLILNGQSIAHIYAKHKDELTCSKRTLYNYVERNALSIKNIDLPRKVRYKKRKQKNEDVPARKYRTGRTYDDYLKYLGEHPEVQPVQMDTVEGRIGGKVLLTIYFCSCHIMLISLLEAKRQSEVKAAFDILEEKFGPSLFRRLFPVILTDNGSEFQNPELIEKNDKGSIRTRIFYCNPNQSWQKGQIEKNHEFIRYIIPKGKSFDNLTEENVLAMCNHINSFTRDSLNDSSPYDLAPILLGRDFMRKAGLHHIPHDEVLLKPSLIKK